MHDLEAIENPYNYNSPADDSMFYGREKEIKTMKDELLAVNKHSCALVAGKRMGKTSFLKALKRKLESVNNYRYFLCPIYIDVLSTKCNSKNEFLHLIADLVRDWLLMNHIETPREGLISLDRFRDLLYSWSGFVWHNRNCGFRIILLIDKCDYFTIKEWDLDFYQELSDLLDISEFSVVMAGSSDWYKKIYTDGSPLYPKLTLHSLGVLDTEATRNLVTKPARISLAEDVVQTVIAESGGHPFLTQYIMYHLWQNGLQNAIKNDVERIAQGFLVNQLDFQKWTENLGKVQIWSEVYRYLYRSSFSQSIDQFRPIFSAITDDMPAVLHALCIHGLVVEERNREVINYRVAGRMFSRWFEQHYESGTSPIFDPRQRESCEQLCKELNKNKKLLSNLKIQRASRLSEPMAIAGLDVEIEEFHTIIKKIETSLDTDCPGWKCK